jgi:hypothetical protein
MILGAAGEVHRSAERSRVLAALQDAAGPMTPKEIQVAAELSSRNATDILLSKMVKATEIVRTGPGRYCLPPDRQNRRKDRTRKTQQPILPVCPGVVERELPKEPSENQEQKADLSGLSDLSGEQ